jgi:hypothetical protein
MCEHNGGRENKKKKQWTVRSHFPSRRPLTCRPDFVQQDVKGPLVSQRPVRIDDDEVVTGSGRGGEEGRPQVFLRLRLYWEGVHFFERT